MEKQDMVRLIEAATAINKLNEDIIRLTGGYPIANKEYKAIYNIYDVIYDNSKYAGRDDDRAAEEFQAIMYGIGMTAEDRYELLSADI